jgi:hypothetical protein
MRTAGAEQFLVVVNLSNTPFRGTVESDGQRWKEVSLPLAQQGPVALPFVAIDAFGFRIFARE